MTITLYIVSWFEHKEQGSSYKELFFNSRKQALRKAKKITNSNVRRIVMFSPKIEVQSLNFWESFVE